MKELQSAFLETVAQRVAEYGFKYKAAEQACLRPIPCGRACLHLAFIKHSQDFDVVADVAVRFDQLEDLVNANNSLLSKKEKRQTYSLGAELGNIAGEGQKRWGLASFAELERVAGQLVDSFKVIGLPYLDRASTLEGAYQLLTSPGRDAWLHSPIHSSRAKRIVGLAKIMGRGDELALKAGETAQMLRDLKDPGLPDFNRFVATLGVEA